LFIGGVGVADGYWNEPVETATRFLPDPFSSSPDARLYKTGDVVKQLAGGAIEFIGRADHQVKIRGYRVELAEVEAALEEHADVRQAVVVVRAEADREQLVAYMTVNGLKAPSHDEIRRTLTQKLPDYMIPSAFVLLESFPLTANGKLNRAALPAPDEARPELQKVFVAPQTELEKEIAEIWSSVLKLNKIGIHDHFFELGGHSLLATQVVARVRKAFHLELPLRSIFDSPTVAEFAERIEKAKDAELAKLLTALEALSDEEAQKLLASEKERRSRENS
jgi:acyl carrier protein